MNFIYRGFICHFILAVSLYKSSFGQTIVVTGQQAQNGTTAEVTWTITTPTDNGFLSFTAYKDVALNDNKILFVTMTTRNITNPQIVDGKIKNVTLTTVKPGVVAIKMFYGPVDQIKDNGLKIAYVVGINPNFQILTEEIQLKVTSKPIICGRILKEKYSINSSSTLNITLDVCGLPMPQFNWSFPSWILPYEPIIGVTKVNSTAFVSSVLLQNVSVENCGRKLYFKAENTDGNLTLESFITITATPPKVNGITAVVDQEQCITTNFQSWNVGLCNVSYEIVYYFGGSSLAIKINSSSYTNCNESIVNATAVNVHAVFGEQYGPFNDNNVNVTAFSTTTTATTAITTNIPSTGTSQDSNNKMPVIVAVVVSLVALGIIVAIVIIVIRKKKTPKRSTRNADSSNVNSYNHVPLDNRDGRNGNNYAPAPRSRPQERQIDPGQDVYASLGAAGGRKGPRTAPEPSNYAEVKVDDKGYPVSGRPGSVAPQPTYAQVDRTRRNSLPPDDDDDGVIV